LLNHILAFSNIELSRTQLTKVDFFTLKNRTYQPIIKNRP